MNPFTVPERKPGRKWPYPPNIMFFLDISIGLFFTSAAVNYCLSNMLNLVSTLNHQEVAR